MSLLIKMEEANNSLRNNDYSKAVIEFKSIVEEWPNNLWALNGVIKALTLDKSYIEIFRYLLQRTSLKLTKHPSDEEFIKIFNVFLGNLRVSSYDNKTLIQLYKVYEKTVYDWCIRLSIDLKLIDFITMDLHNQTKSNNEKSSRTAVLITGQFRGCDYSINSIKKFIGNVDCDVYIAAWDSYGFRDITSDKRSYKHLGRTYDEDFCQLVADKNVDLTGYLDAARKLKAVLGKPFKTDFIQQEFPGSVIKVLNEKEFEKKFLDIEHKLIKLYSTTEEGFAASINMLKMVYANYIGMKAARESEVQYSHVLKVRPDFIFNNETSLDELLVSSNQLRNCSFLDCWGGGIGDQFFFGNWIDGQYYNDLWTFWLNMEEPVDDIGNLLKPHKRLKDYMRFGKKEYLLLPDIRAGLDDSARITKEQHIELVSSDYSYFSRNARNELVSLFELYKI